MFNFDDEALLFYDDFTLDLDKINNPNSNPYSLISKKDGCLISVLNIHLSHRYSTKTRRSVGPNQSSGTLQKFPQNMQYGPDFVIADISSDTLYLFTQNRELTPLLVRKPSVHASEPRMLWATQRITDRFIVIGKISEGSGRIPELMYEFQTGKISELSLLDHVVCRRDGTWLRSVNFPTIHPAIGKNWDAQLIWPSFLIDAMKDKRLSGDVEKLAKSLNIDDNPVVRIIKFK